MRELMIKLHTLGVLKVGTFELTKDFVSPFAIECRSLISHPKVAANICHHLWEKGKNLPHDLLCGVPHVGACFANYIAWEKDVPLILCQESAAFGLQERVMGMYKTGARALLIQDSLVFGSDVLETIESLEEEGVLVRDVISLFDLELGGKQKLKKRGYVSHSVFLISEALQILSEVGKIPGDAFKLAEDFLEGQKESGKFKH